MEKVRRCIKFDKNYLGSLKEDSHACVEVIKNIRHLSLHPFHLSDVNYSIKEILGEQIGKYDKKLNGILLSFQNIKLLRSIGSISFDSSFTHIDIEAEYFVFKPEVGKVLRGVVNKKSKDHVGCLVHKFFNVSLPRPPNCENWLGSVLQIGHEIEFRITFTNLEARLPYIKAEIISLLSEDSGISTGEEGNNHAVNTITKFETDELVDDNDGDAVLSSKQKKNRKRKFSERTSSHDDEDEAESSRPKHKKRKRSKSENETSYTLTGILNYIQEEEGGGETSKKKKTSGEKDNDEENKKRGKKSRKSKHVTGVHQEDKHNSAVSDEAVSKNRKMKRKISELDDSFTSKKRKVHAQEQEVGLQEENSARKLKHKNALNVSDMKDKTKRKNSANGTLSDLNLSEIFNETFTDRKPRNKKKHKVDVKNGTQSDLDLGEILNETFTVTKSKNKKQQKVHAEEVITEKELVNKKEKRSSELNPNDSLLRRPDSSMEKSKKRKKENSGSDLLGLNFDDIINESVVQEMSSKSERKRSKSQPRGVEANESISKSEKKRSKSQVRDVETNLATELFPPQIGEAKSKKKKKRDSDLSQVDFQENSISPIISQRENARSKSQPRQVEENHGISKSEKKSKSQARETNLARELFPSQIDKSEESKSNKKKKKRDSDLSISQINFEDIINESAVEVNDAKSKKSRKKKPKKSKDEKDMDVSLPELNLDQLFSEGVNKRNSSHGNSSWQDKTFELPSDSDMENIFSSCFPKSNHKSKKKT